MNLRNSPISKTPPSYGIPDFLVKGKQNHCNNLPKRSPPAKNRVPTKIEDHEEHQFQIDI